MAIHFLCVGVALFRCLDSVRAFSLGPLTLPTSSRRVVVPLLQLAADRDDYDDWYDDFDPSSFDTNEPATFARGGGGGGDGGGRRGGGRRDGGRRDGGRHDYVRDVQADNSNVDVDTVNALISERLQYRKTGRFDEADAIRDELLDQHGVRVLDREKMWRSGCSRSGSGRQWGGGSGGGRRPAQQRNRRQQPREFGPNGHDYNLSMDAGPNVSSMSEDEIHARIAERLQCKMTRNFRVADAIQMDLEKIGVYIHDGKKEWRADGESYGDYQMGKRGPGRDDRNRPYTQAAASQDTEFKEQIQALVDERSEAKKTRSFDVADDIRDELRQLYNVEVDDRSRQWSVGGNFGGDDRAAPGNRFNEPKPFSRRGGGSLSAEDLEKITKMLDQRDEAKANRQFGKADKIRDDLREEYLIRIDDRSREWHVVTEEFVMSPDVPMDEEVKELIEQKIKERSVAKLKKEYETADAIRDELWEQFSVRIDDRVREWRVEVEVEADYDSESGPFIEENDVTESDVADLQSEVDQALDSESVETEDLSDLKVDELKERLRAAGLPVSGKKAELIERLSNN